MSEEQNRFSLRKLSVGLASVLIGVSIFGASQTVKADTVANSQASSVTNTAQSSDTQKNENAVKSTFSNDNQANNAKSNLIQTQVEAKKDQKQDSVSKTQEVNDSNNLDAEKSIVSTSSLQEPDNQSDNHAEDNSQTQTSQKLDLTKNSPKFARKVLATNLTQDNSTQNNDWADPARGIDPVKFASNGGFDPKIWGIMDTSEWQLDASGNITGYTGDMSHIIIPNASDFAKDGKSYRQISISSDEMKTLGDLGNWNVNTLAISLTDNKKVKATNADWSYTFFDTSLKQANLEGLDTGNVTNMNAMFSGARSLTSLDVSKWDTGNVTNMNGVFYNATNLTNIGNLDNWDVSKVTDMSVMFWDTSSLTSLDVSKWDTGNVTDISGMFGCASSLTSLDVSNWDTGKVTNMSNMFYGASSLTSLDVSKWNTGNVTDMWGMFEGARSLALIANSGKFADYLVNHANFADSKINSNVKSVTTDNTKLLKLLTNDSQHDSANRTIVFTFPANYSPDLAKYHLTKIGNTYQIKQSADYDKSYLQGTVLINATGDITEHHIDTTEQYTLSDTWQPNYDKLVLAHKNSDGSVSFDNIQLPQIPGYKTVASPVNPARALFAVSFMALSKPVAPAINDVKPAETVTTATPADTEITEPIKTEPKVATTPKVIDLSDDAVVTTPKETTWKVDNEPDQDTYRVSNGKYAVELPHISNTQLHVIANDSTKDSILFTYKGQNSKYTFKIKFVNGHYLLTTYKIKSGKLVKLIDYNFIKSSKMINVIVDWIKLK